MSMIPTIEQFFASDGLLVKVKPDFQKRDGQQELSSEISRAIYEQRHIIIEAPTGFGKSFAALVPAILEAIAEGKRVVISTGTLALQDQYAEKDVPLLAQALSLAGHNLTYAVAKGRGNYICRQKLDETEYSGASNLMSWAVTQKVETCSGDVSSVPFPFNPGDWMEIGADEDCERKACPYYGEGRKGWSDCFVYQAHRRFLEAQIVITNHVLALIDIGNEPGTILGPYDVIIFDEAHSVPNKARDCWGTEINPRSISRMIKLVDRILSRVRVDVFEHGFIEEYRKLENQIFAPLEPMVQKGDNIRLRQIKPKSAVEEAKEAAANVVTHLRSLNQTLNDCICMPEDDPQTVAIRACKEKVLTMARNLVNVFGDNIDPEFADNWLSYLEIGSTPKGIKYGVLNLKPIEVAPLLRERLFNVIPTVVLMSATMQIGKTFTFMRRQLGLPESAIEFVGESPFDLEQQVLVYLPKHIPEQSDPAYLSALAEETKKIIMTMKGRSLVLFTNANHMRWVHNKVSQEVGYYCYLQGTASKQRLLQAFTADTTSCLFATKTFFEGVDIPGESLSCVVLAKAPFPVPTDPLFQAQSDKLDEQGLDSFALLSMPQMLFDMKQAFGRLIRTVTDKGMFACLDSRATWRKGYSVRVRGILPQSRVIVHLGDTPGQVDTTSERVYSPPRRSRAALLLTQDDD